MGTAVSFLEEKEKLFQGEAGINKKEGELEVKIRKDNGKIFLKTEACLALPRLVNFVGESLSNLSLDDLNKKLAIIDFLNRLKKYARDITVIPNETVDIVIPNPTVVEQNDDANVSEHANHYALD
jgi:hypothetical protein